MNICMVAYTYYPKDPRVRKEAEALAGNGYSVDIICIRQSGEKREEIINGVRVFRLPMQTARESGKLRYVYQYLMFFLLATFAVSVFHFRKRYHVVHTHSLPDFIVFAGIFPKLFGAKLVLDLHESMPDIYLSKFNAREGFVYKLVCLAERISTSVADAVITVSEYIAKLLVERRTKKEKLTVIPNVPDIDFYPPKCSDAKDIVFAGNLTEYQDIDTVLDAMVKLPDFKFHIFGDGILLPRIKEKIVKLNLTNRVFLYGFVPQNELRRKLITSDWFIAVHPCRNIRLAWIALGNKALEYTFLGYVVVSSDMPGVREVFSDECFYYYLPEDAESLANAIRLAYSEKVKTIEKIKKAQEVIRRKGMSWSDVKGKLFQLYSRLTAES
ncbi:MAG: glycosyltransferase family 4 protein [Thermoplasmata archaeon]